MTSFFDRKIKTPVLDLLHSGVSPDKLALSIAFGVSCGLFPIPGITSVPVVIAIFLFRLNPVAPMLANYLCTPLNLATVPLFIHYGNLAFGSSPLSIQQILQDLQENTLTAMWEFRLVLLHGVLAWIGFVPFATAIVYIALLPLLKATMIKKETTCTNQNKKTK